MPCPWGVLSSCVDWLGLYLSRPTFQAQIVNRSYHGTWPHLSPWEKAKILLNKHCVPTSYARATWATQETEHTAPRLKELLVHS